MWKKYTGFLLTALAVVSFVLGVAFRAQYIFVSHPAERYVYSDMGTYTHFAHRLFDPSAEFSKYDSVYPPGGGIYYGTLFKIDGFNAVYYAQFLLSVCIPLLLGAIGYVLYGRRVAEIGIILSSIYPSFVMLAGFVLSENPYIAFHLLSFLLILLALRTQTILWSLVFGLGAGLALGITSSFRSVALYTMVPVMVLVAVLICVRGGRTHRYAAFAFGAGLLALLIPLTIWCTTLMGGKICVGSTNGAMGVLQGHHGNVGVFNWYDTERSAKTTFANPTALQKGMLDEVHLPFGPYDSAENIAEAFRYIKAHPVESLGTSFRHIYDLFHGTLPWPMSHTSDRNLVAFSESWFLVVIFFPALMYLLLRTAPRTRGNVSRGFEDGVVLAPLLGIIIVVFLTIAEPRYRIPYDPFLMLLAARAYTFGVVSGKGLGIAPLSLREIRDCLLWKKLFQKNSFGRFAIVGLLNTCVTLLFLNLILLLWGTPTRGVVVGAYVFASIMGILNSFYWNRRFVFERSPSTRSPITSFFLVTALGLAIGAGVVSMLYPLFLTFVSPILAANSISIASIVFQAVWNYCWYRFYVFAPHRHPSP